MGSDGRPGAGDGREGAASGLLRLSDLTAEEFARLRRLTVESADGPDVPAGAGGGGTVLCWFTVPSRTVSTLVSLACRSLGQASLVVDPEALRMARVGSLENAARVLSSLGSLLVVGGLEHAEVERVAASSSVPVVNAFSDAHNPCEALAELAVFERRLGSLRGARLAYLGQACNVTHDLMAGSALAGAELCVATPEGCQPAAHIAAHASVLARRHGGRLEVTRRPAVAVAEAEGIVFGPLPRSWRHLDSSVVAAARPGATMLSCSSEAELRDWPLDGRQSRSDDHRECRHSAYRAVLFGLAEGMLVGGPQGLAAG